MSITLETVGKGLLIAGLAARYGCIRTGLGVLAVSLFAQLVGAVLMSYKIAKVKSQLQSFQSHH